MNIRAKLFVLIAVLVVAFGLAGTTYLLLSSQTGKILAEQSTLKALRTALLNEGFQANGLASGQLEDQIGVFNQTLKQTSTSFQQVQELKVLPRVSKLIASALTTIQQLDQLLAGATQNLLSSVTDVRSDAKRFYASSPNSYYSVYQLLADEQLHHSPLVELTVYHVQSLMNQIGILAADLQQAITIIDNQDSVITGEIQRVSSRSDAIALVTMLILLAGTALLTLLLARQIVRSVKSIAGGIAFMREGDLTHEFTVATRDEIGRLANNLNEFLLSLKSSISNVQSASAENVRMKESLIVTTEQTSASTTQITANTESINHQISALDSNLASSTKAVESIGESIRILNEQIQEQMAMVEESTASVTEMIASIDHVTTTADKRREATDRLVATVASGGQKMRATFGIVNQINESVGSIKDITSIIEGISSQTNLLAMNAAIEAAHAGDAGRGFSVVADEIRKLAEASSSNSQEIAKILKIIVDRVSEATSAGATMDGAFKEIEREVKDLSASLAEIFSSMSELRSGGSQILEAMTVLQEVSTNVKGGSTTINRSSTEIRSSMAAVQQVSSQVRSGMAEIAHGIREISTAVGNVLSIAEHLGELSDSLNHDLAKFKTA